MKKLLLALFCAFACIPSATQAQTIPDAAYQEAIGRSFVTRYGATPGRSMGPSGETWETEFLYRKTKAVRDLAAKIAVNPPSPDACAYRILAADNYYAEQLKIAADCMKSSGSPSSPRDYNRGWNDYRNAINLPPLRD